MKKRLICFFLCALMLTTAALADTGPKPSVQIDISGLDGECWGTLLSETESTGPASVYKGNVENRRYNPKDEEYEIWEKFVQYTDPDGYYFLQELWCCSDTNSLNWTYYPPESFKLLLYFPETDTFVCSGIYERYAFDSFFAATYANGSLTLVQTRNAGTQLLGFCARVLITLAIELLIALIFGIRAKDQWKFIIVVNIITQILLNYILYHTVPAGYGWAFLCMYVILELGVLIVESVLYTALLPKMCKERLKHPVLYAFAANTLSFVGGMYIARLLPAVF